MYKICAAMFLHGFTGPKYAERLSNDFENVCLALMYARA